MAYDSASCAKEHARVHSVLLGCRQGTLLFITPEDALREQPSATAPPSDESQEDIEESVSVDLWTPCSLTWSPRQLCMHGRDLEGFCSCLGAPRLCCEMWVKVLLPVEQTQH